MVANTNTSGLCPNQLRTYNSFYSLHICHTRATSSFLANSKRPKKKSTASTLFFFHLVLMQSMYVLWNLKHLRGSYVTYLYNAHAHIRLHTHTSARIHTHPLVKRGKITCDLKRTWKTPLLPNWQQHLSGQLAQHYRAITTAAKIREVGCSHRTHQPPPTSPQMTDNAILCNQTVGWGQLKCRFGNIILHIP